VILYFVFCIYSSLKQKSATNHKSSQTNMKRHADYMYDTEKERDNKQVKIQEESSIEVKTTSLVPTILENVEGLVPAKLRGVLYSFIKSLPRDTRLRDSKLADFVEKKTPSIDLSQPILMRVVFKMFNTVAMRGGYTLTLKNHNVKPYRYTGVVPLTWDLDTVPCVAQLRDLLSIHYKVDFNLCLINVMDPCIDEKGANVLGAHRDAENGLVKGAPIACFVLCPTKPRIIRLHWSPVGQAKKMKNPLPAASVDIAVPHGSVYTMLNWCQQGFKHEVLKGEEWRASFTFRVMQ
jgi:hypothetical protein